MFPPAQNVTVLSSLHLIWDQSFDCLTGAGTCGAHDEGHSPETPGHLLQFCTSINIQNVHLHVERVHFPDLYSGPIGPLHDPVTWHKITHAGEQVAQWDYQNNATRSSPPGPAFVLGVPLHEF